MSDNVSQALARKWRPRDFESLVGQQHVVQALSHALDHNRLHHAYLFTGTRGVGKTTIARIMAKAVNCEQGMSRNPCGQCQTCQEINQGRFVDLLEVDAATNTKVDEMRALLENAMYAPTSGRYKVYVIDEVHMLSSSAFNAMLKTLEEPPPHVLFILATTDPQKIPATVLSRCLQFSLRQLLPDQIAEHLGGILEKEDIQFEPAALRLIAKAARGSLRDALSLTDQAIAYSAGVVSEATVRQMLGSVDQQVIVQILQALADGDGAALLNISQSLANVSAPFATLLDELASASYRLSIAAFAGDLSDDPDSQALMALQGQFSPEDLQLFYQIATHARGDLHLAPEDYIGFSMALLRMLAFKPGGQGAAGLGQNSSSPQKTQSAEMAAIKEALAAPKAKSKPVQSIPPWEMDEPEQAPASESGPAQALPVAPQPPATQAVLQPTVKPMVKPSVKPEVSANLPTPANWPEVSQNIPATGLMRQALVQAELMQCETTEGNVTLHLKTDIKTYAEGPMLARMEALLSDHFGTTIKVNVTLGKAEQTARALQTENRKQAMQEAQASLAQDPFLNQISQTMGATIVQGSERSLHGGGPADI